MDITPFMPLITGALGGAVSAGVFKGPVDTLTDIWFITFGHSINEYAQKIRAKQDRNIELYKEDIAEEISKVPEQNIQEPQLEVVGPAIEASKYYTEKPELRKMFAKLIASSMDKSKDKITRSAFVDIIRQMTPLDAQILVKINDSGLNGDLICNLSINNLDEHGAVSGSNNVLKNVYIGDGKFRDILANATSLDNLSRLGLINISFMNFRSDKKQYDIFKTLPTFGAINEQCKVGSFGDKKKEPYVEKGITQITGFGKNFYEACLE